MKTKNLYLPLFILVFLTSASFAETTFSFRPSGINLSPDLFSTDLGIVMGPLSLYASFAGAYWNSEGTIDQEWWEDYTEYSDTSHTENLSKSWQESIEGDVTFMTLAPSAGIRLSIVSSGDVFAYIFGDAFKAFTTMNAKGSWRRKSYDTEGQLTYESIIEVKDNEVTSITKDYTGDEMIITEQTIGNYEEIIKSAENFLSPIGAKVGIGVDYKITEHISVFGEFAVQGLLMLSNLDDEDSGNNDGDSMDDWKRVIEGEITSLFGITQSWLGLRFHF